MPDAVGGWEFRDEDTIHCPRQLQVRQEKVRTWTKAVDRRMAGEHESERGLERWSWRCQGSGFGSRWLMVPFSEMGTLSRKQLYLHLAPPWPS